MLLGMLSDGSPDVRSAAVAAIGYLGDNFVNGVVDSRVASAVSSLARDECPSVRVCCACALSVLSVSPEVLEAVELLKADS